MDRKVTPDMIDYPFTEDWGKGFKWYNAPAILEKPPEVVKQVHSRNEINQLKGQVLYLQNKLNSIRDKKENIYKYNKGGGLPKRRVATE